MLEGDGLDTARLCVTDSDKVDLFSNNVLLGCPVYVDCSSHSFTFVDASLALFVRATVTSPGR